MTEEEIDRRVDRLTATDAAFLIRSLVDCLYGGNPDKEWGADTLDGIAGLMHAFGLSPEVAE